MTRGTKRRKSPIHLAFGLFLACASAGPASAQTAVLALSPDVTLELGAGNVVTTDHSVAVDNLNDIVALENLGPIPESADLTGYADSGGARRYFTVDTTVTLPGNVTVRPADVAYWDQRRFGLAFDSRLAGIPDGVAVDALALPLSGGQFLLSFDTHVTLPGNLTVGDEDVVRFGNGTFSLLLDGSAFGIPSELDLDGLTDLGGGSFLLSFDTGGTIDGIPFQDQDVMLLKRGSWALEYKLEGLDSSWAAADLDALDFVPEPGAGLMLAAGVGMLGGLGRRTRRRIGPALVWGLLAATLGPEPARAQSYRVSFVEYDFDADGRPDAIRIPQYAASGRPHSIDYEYFGDGTPDLFVTEDSEVKKETVSTAFDDQGRLISHRSVTTDFAGSTESVDSSQTFVGDHIAMMEFRGESEDGTSSSVSVEFDYSGDLLTTARLLLDDGWTMTFDYGSDSLPDAASFVVPLLSGPDPTATISTSYSWREDGQVDDVSTTQVVGTIVFGGSGDYVYDDQGRRIAEVFSVGAWVSEFNRDYRKSIFYDSLGLIDREEIDIGDDGSVEAIRTYSWSEGPCVEGYLWSPVGRPEFPATAGSSFTPGVGWQSLRNCPEPTVGFSLVVGGACLATLGRRRGRTGR